MLLLKKGLKLLLVQLIQELFAQDWHFNKVLRHWGLVPGVSVGHLDVLLLEEELLLLLLALH